MLVALTNDQKRIVLTSSFSKEKLQQLRTNKHFFCPQCKEPLQLKIGSIKIPHFAHVSKSKCDTYFSEGETAQHLLGKEQLYQMFLQLGFQVELEPYLAHLKQRPDLLVRSKNGRVYAIEFQCSSILPERFNERNAGYQRATITPIWVPATPVKQFTGCGIMKFSVNQHLQRFILSNKQQCYFMTYSPDKKEFLYVSNLHYIHGNTFLAKVQTLSLSDQRFPFYIPKLLTKKEFTQYLNAYYCMKERYLRSRVAFSRKGVNDLFLRSLYELRLTSSSLPNFIGVPIKGGEMIKIFSVEWQVSLFYFLHINNLSIPSFNERHIGYFLKWMKLQASSEMISVVKRYHYLLQKLNVENVYSFVSPLNLLNQLYSQFLANK